jgi:hypothetical protein
MKISQIQIRLLLNEPEKDLIIRCDLAAPDVLPFERGGL